MMNESKRTTLRVLCSAGFMLGLMALLVESRSTGESLERFKLVLSGDPVSAIGAAVAGLAVLCFVAIQIFEHREHRRHLHRHV
jgi:hypothetical protein